MGRTPCCDKKGLKKGPWTPEEDDLLVNYIQTNGGHGSWRSLPKMAGLLRCGKSCRLRWTNYLRPNIKRGPFTTEEEKLVIQLHGILGNRWAAIASQLPGRTDNEVKNLWNTHLKKRLVGVGHIPKICEPFTSDFAAAAMASTSSSTRHMAQWESARLEAEARLSRESSLFKNPTLCKSTTDVDFFLRLWNSEVGEAFRKVKFETDNSTCQSSKSQNSISTKCVSVSAITAEVVVIDHNPAAPSFKSSNQNEYLGKSYLEDLIMPVSDSSSSNELGDSSDTALQLLLDFPINNDMSFLETNLDKYATSSGSLL